MAKTTRKPLTKPSSTRGGREPGIADYPSLCNSFGYGMVRAGVFLRTLMDEALSESRIIAPQFAILTILSESGPMSQIEIGTVLLIDKATMVKLIDDLETQKYVTRIADPVDRRIKRIQISAAGRKVRGQARELRRSLEGEVLAPLSTKERKQLAEILPKLLEHLRAMSLRKD